MSLARGELPALCGLFGPWEPLGLAWCWWPGLASDQSDFRLLSPSRAAVPKDRRGGGRGHHREPTARPRHVAGALRRSAVFAGVRAAADDVVSGRALSARSRLYDPVAGAF